MNGDGADALRLSTALMLPPVEKGRYLYKVFVDQRLRRWRYVEAASIEEAERHGVVISMVRPVEPGRILLR